MRPREAAERLAGPEPPLVLDVREAWEYALCHLDGAVLIPLRELPAQAGSLDPDREILVVCHHGIRSRLACRYLEQECGFHRLINLAGGLDAWAREVDPHMPTY